MKRVYKYPVPIDDNFDLELPVGAEVLSAQAQHGFPFLWALVDDEVATEKRQFRLVGTGHPILESGLTFIDTIQLKDGGFIVHLFECVAQAEG